MLFAPKEKGQGLVEYALILVLVQLDELLFFLCLTPPLVIFSAISLATSKRNV